MLGYTFRAACEVCEEPCAMHHLVSHPSPYSFPSFENDVDMLIEPPQSNCQVGAGCSTFTGVGGEIEGDVCADQKALGLQGDCTPRRSGRMAKSTAEPDLLTHSSLGHPQDLISEDVGDIVSMQTLCLQIDSILPSFHCTTPIGDEANASGHRRLSAIDLK